ncbi:MAG: hypothetical protein AB1568_17315 [Thermodesulfobacteriota bacterium]
MNRGFFEGGKADRHASLAMTATGLRPSHAAIVFARNNVTKRSRAARRPGGGPGVFHEKCRQPSRLFTFGIGLSITKTITTTVSLPLLATDIWQSDCTGPDRRVPENI